MHPEHPSWINMPLSYNNALKKTALKVTTVNKVRFLCNKEVSKKLSAALNIERLFSGQYSISLEILELKSAENLSFRSVQCTQTNLFAVNTFGLELGQSNF